MKGRALLLCALVALLVGAGWLVATRNVDNAEHADAVRALVQEQKPAWVEESKLGTELWTIQASFYESRGYLPAWIDGVRSTARLRALVEALERSAEHGLDPDSYGTDAILRQMEDAERPLVGVRFDPERVPEIDARLTHAYLHYAADLLGRRRSPRDVNAAWPATRNTDDLEARLARATGGEDVAATLEELAPAHPQYQGLRRALARATSESDAARIRINMERWRWTTRALGDRYILVNIPAYQLQVVERDAPVLAMRVIVGADETQTPVFSDRMTYIVFSPYWNIPESILREETLPRVLEDPGYLARNRIEVLDRAGDDEPLDPQTIDWNDESQTKDLRFRQAPGPENALGLVKFIFPNHFAVYLHDTPNDRLFDEEERAFSHGCVRVEDPVALAKYVLRDRPNWTNDRIVQAMNGESEQTVRLETPVPVHLGYWTAWVEPDGQTVTFTSDPYGIDERHARLWKADAERRG